MNPGYRNGSPPPKWIWNTRAAANWSTTAFASSRERSVSVAASGPDAERQWAQRKLQRLVTSQVTVIGADRPATRTAWVITACWELAGCALGRLRDKGASGVQRGEEVADGTDVGFAQVEPASDGIDQFLQGSTV